MRSQISYIYILNKLRQTKNEIAVGLGQVTEYTVQSKEQQTCHGSAELSSFGREWHSNNICQEFVNLQRCQLKSMVIIWASHYYTLSQWFVSVHGNSTAENGPGMAAKQSILLAYKLFLCGMKYGQYFHSVCLCCKLLPSNFLSCAKLVWCVKPHVLGMRSFPMPFIRTPLLQICFH